jgi:trk system potassium uptake protein TrkA
MVIEGDATDLDLLAEERVGEANVFVATTKDDENNMIACQLAKAQGVDRSVALINKSSYTTVYDLLGLDLAVSPRLLCASKILRFVRAGSPSTISVLAEGKAEVLELIAPFREPVEVQTMGLPKGAVIGAVIHGDSVKIARGDTTIQRGDRVIIFVLPGTHEAIEKLFRD